LGMTRKMWPWLPSLNSDSIDSALLLSSHCILRRFSYVGYEVVVAMGVSVVWGNKSMRHVVVVMGVMMMTVEIKASGQILWNRWSVLAGLVRLVTFRGRQREE
jgi:hypothetical protein